MRSYQIERGNVSTNACDGKVQCTYSVIIPYSIYNLSLWGYFYTITQIQTVLFILKQLNQIQSVRRLGVPNYNGISMLTAMVYGQGNVRTFDNEDYDVCGEGDFILLQSSPLTIEGRFQRSPFNRKFIISLNFEIRFA